MASPTTIYLLDTNIFIAPYRTYYSFDFAMPFWEFLVQKGG